MPLRASLAEKPTYAEIPSSDDLSIPYSDIPASPKHERIHSIVVYTSLFILGFIISSALGFFFQYKASTAPSYGINPKMPIPHEIFNRHPVSFIPDQRYIGPSNTVNRNWKELTKGLDLTSRQQTQTRGLTKIQAPIQSTSQTPRPII
jgi:hypothetical protein